VPIVKSTRAWLDALKFRWRLAAMSNADVERETRRRQLLDDLGACDRRLISVYVLATHGQDDDASHLLRELVTNVVQLERACVGESLDQTAGQKAVRPGRNGSTLRRWIEAPEIRAYLAPGGAPTKDDVGRAARVVDAMLGQLRSAIDYRQHTDLRTPVGQFNRSARIQIGVLVSIFVLAAATGVGLHQKSLYWTNLAVGKPTAQSSTSGNATADRAVDGIADGDLAHGSMAVTLDEDQPWWQVDLGQPVPIRSIQLWNRTDCCADRLANFYVLVSNQPFATNDLSSSLIQDGVSTLYFGRAFPYFASPIEAPFARRGRFVRVQLAGRGQLALAEVKVWRALGPFLSTY
jgi:hypothetical protein